MLREMQILCLAKNNRKLIRTNGHRALTGFYILSHVTVNVLGVSKLEEVEVHSPDSSASFHRVVLIRL